MSGRVEETPEKPHRPVQRLCNEIQLFDLCDLETCRYKQGRFCTDEELLTRFESIAEEEERPVAGRDSAESDDSDPEDDLDRYDDGFDDQDYPEDDYQDDE